MTTDTGEFIRVRNGVKLRAGPAREPAFNVVTDQLLMHKAPEGTPESFREQLHSNVNEEMQSLEIAAQCLVEFPGEQWEIRMCLARQCWDEVRHAWLFYNRLVELPGFTAAMSGIATVAVGMIFRLGMASMKDAVRHIPSMLVLLATFVAVGLLQWPLLPVLLTLAPLSIAAAYMRPAQKAPHE